jgi:Fe-S oxidoreductase
MAPKKKYGFEEKYRDQILKCSKCGFCRAVCPAFSVSLRPALNARGKMILLKEVMDGKIELDDALSESLYQCTTCANCAENCPSGVQVPEIIKEARKDLVQCGVTNRAFEGLNKVLSEHTNIYAEDEPYDFEREKNKKAEIVFFVGCVGTYREEETVEQTLELLDHLKVDYTLIDEVCCSGVLDDLGYALNESLAAQNVKNILATGASKVVTACPYCYRTFINKDAYKDLREKGLEIMHITQFLKDFDFGVTTDKVVSYHDPCDLGRHMNIFDEPRQIIKKIAPNFVELQHSGKESFCCGSGGGMRGAFASNSIAISRKRLEEANVDVLLTECFSCVHNLRQAKLRKQKLEIYNISEFINQLYREKEGA